ncbi:MAG: SGNH/GDSL hydrolase family protein [Treponema sp.]|jgi:lysophospholipase L1-like esterase|nr:SGNH/GDSL hydrolase family protein [Treponema sp.]
MKKTIVKGTAVCLAALALAGLGGCGRNGNAADYDVEKIEVLADSPLKGKTLYFLGSSVTIGYGSGGTAFPHYIAKRNQCAAVVEAVTGTTLMDKNANSYVRRMEFGSKFDKNAKVDLFICQLSTNDTGGGTVDMLNLGDITGPAGNLDAYDKTTITGAIEYIIAYARRTWDCPVLFYSCSRRNDPRYGKMADRLNELAAVWNIGVLDLWNDGDFNNITKEQRKLWMKDETHPTKAGYLEWWTPVVEQFLYANVR